MLWLICTFSSFIWVGGRRGAESIMFDNELFGDVSEFRS